MSSDRVSPPVVVNFKCGQSGARKEIENVLESGNDDGDTAISDALVGFKQDVIIDSQCRGSL